MPPLEFLEGNTSEDDDNLTVVSVENIASDGVKEQWPTHSRFTPEEPTIYKEKLATMWMKHEGDFEKGRHYTLNNLPDGFLLMSRPRISQPDTRDKFLYGHPSGGYFNSPNNFWPHFFYLATGRASPCQCALCREKSSTVVRRDMPRDRGKHPSREAGARGGRRGGYRKARAHIAEDEEGTQDIFKELVYKLKSQLKIDEEITEPESMDWRAERTQLRHHFTRMFMQYSFIPRVGELVLWCPESQGEIRFNPDNSSFQVFCLKKKAFIGFPKWRAGTVAQVPEEPVSLRDAVEETDKKCNINMSGFRVETFPDPNGSDKNLSCQYKYVPLCNIRPLSYWDVFLQNVPTDQFHPSIQYALTIMSSFSMLDKYRFKGEWPNASVFCRGMYLGSELLIRGDGVRLKPRKFGTAKKSDDSVTDILVINSICLQLLSCDADISSPQLCETTTPRICGKVYTISPERAYREPGYEGPPKPLSDEEIIDAFETTGMRGYAPWYRLHAPETEMQVSINQILGRLYESEYMNVVLGDKSFGIDFEGLANSRRYGRETDERISVGKEWFCGDSRMEALALETFNGHEVGPYDDARDLKMWRANLKIIDGTATAADIRDAKVQRDMSSQRMGLVGGKTTSSFESIGKTSTMVRNALELAGPSARASPRNGAEYEIEASDGDESDELAEILQPMYARGGTEESSGGDFDPAARPKVKRLKM